MNRVPSLSKSALGYDETTKAVLGAALLLCLASGWWRRGPTVPVRRDLFLGGAGPATGHQNLWVNTLPVCSWCGPEPRHPGWGGAIEASFAETVRRLNAENVTYWLVDGSLLGAWRATTVRLLPLSPSPSPPAHLSLPISLPPPRCRRSQSNELSGVPTSGRHPRPAAL